MIRKVSTTLEFGAIYTGFFLYFLLILCIISSCLTLSLSIIEDSYLYLAFAVCLISTICFVIIIIINHKNCVKVKEWLKDAIITTAYCQTMDNSMIFSGLIPLKTKKIIVIFSYNEQKICRESGKRSSNSWLNGYSSLFKKYADKEIKIAYSPTYDQVMILKDQT